MKPLPRTPLALAALALTLALPARAEPGDAFEQMAGSGVLEAVLGQVVAGIDVDAAITGIGQSAQAAAEGRPAPEPEALTRARAQLDRNMQVAAPMLARALFSVLAPTLREIRAEVARDLADAGGR